MKCSNSISRTGAIVLAAVATAAASPTTRPLCEVDTSQPLTQRASRSDTDREAIAGLRPDRRVKGQRLRHTIDFTDEGTPTGKAKPAGVLGADPIRAAPGRKRFLSLGPTPPTSTMSDVGSGISGVRRFGCVLAGLHPPSHIPHPTSGGGETGPWSETATATIGA